jgi:hypothetical protein
MGDVWYRTLTADITSVGHPAVGQIATDSCIVGSLCEQRSFIQSATGHFHLWDTAIRAYLNLFSTALPAVLCEVGMTVVEHIPLAFDTYDSAVVVAGGGQPIFGFAAVQSNIAVGDDYPAVSEIPVRVFAGGITQLMLGFRGIDEIVAIPYFANGTK